MSIHLRSPLPGRVGCGAVSPQAVTDDPFSSDCSKCKDLLVLAGLLSPDGLSWKWVKLEPQQKEYRVPEHVNAVDAALARCDRNDHGPIEQDERGTYCLTCGREGVKGAVKKMNKFLRAPEVVFEFLDACAARDALRPPLAAQSPAAPDAVASLTECVQGLTELVDRLEKALNALEGGEARQPSLEDQPAEKVRQRGSERAGDPSPRLPVDTWVAVRGDSHIGRIMRAYDDGYLVWLDRNTGYAVSLSRKSVREIKVEESVKVKGDDRVWVIRKICDGYAVLHCKTSLAVRAADWSMITVLTPWPS